MAKTEVTTNAIKSILLDPVKLEKFKVMPDNKTREEYIDFVLTSIFTHIGIKENAPKFAMLNTLCRTSQADISYLVQLLSETRENDKSFRVLPVLELYESLLRENWELVKYERDILDATESYSYTAASNMKICNAIANFLKEHVLTKPLNTSSEV